MPNTGLANISAGETAICRVDPAGQLHYRGYDVKDLCSHASYEEVAYLLIYKELPDQDQLSHYRKRLAHLRVLPHPARHLLELIPPTASPMDVLRTACSFLGSIAPETSEFCGTEIADHLVALLPSALLYWHHFHHSAIKINTESDALSTAEFFLDTLFQSKTDPLLVSMLDQSLILFAEHEFNASTFSARVTTGTNSDFYSAICSAIGTLKGPLHGEAISQAYKLITRFPEPEQALVGVKAMLTNRETIPGFGHRVYRDSDPRAVIMKQWADKLSCHSSNHRLYDLSEAIEKLMREDAKSFPNVDFYTATTYATANIPVSLFAPIFAVARVTGWSAHVLEQRNNNTLIRPIADYIGPDAKEFVSLGERQSVKEAS